MPVLNLISAMGTTGCISIIGLSRSTEYAVQRLAIRPYNTPNIICFGESSKLLSIVPIITPMITRVPPM